MPHGRGSVNRSLHQQMERPPRPPTVDLTGDGPPPVPVLHSVSRGRARGRSIMGRHTCQVCDKAFSTPESLGQHMTLHRSPGKLPYRWEFILIMRQQGKFLIFKEYEYR